MPVLVEHRGPRNIEEKIRDGRRAVLQHELDLAQHLWRDGRHKSQESEREHRLPKSLLREKPCANRDQQQHEGQRRGSKRCFRGRRDAVEADTGICEKQSDSRGCCGHRGPPVSRSPAGEEPPMPRNQINADHGDQQDIGVEFALKCEPREPPKRHAEQDDQNDNGRDQWLLIGAGGCSRLLESRNRVGG